MQEYILSLTEGKMTTFTQACQEAYQLSRRYNKIYCVFKEMNGLYSLVSERYANDNRLNIEFKPIID